LYVSPTTEETELSIWSRIAKFARSPQGRRAAEQAMRYARSEKGRRQIAQARERVARGRKPRVGR
jgi:hypothetical protein